MPLYEYYCPANNKIYTFLARTLAYRDKVPLCPDDPALPLEKRVSSFAVIGRAKEETDNDPFAGVDEAKMESLMSELEGEMGGMDEENPDPRQMGRFMRKMTDLMGDKTPPELREIVRRLESGEDPEKLEADFGDLGEGEDADAALFGQVKKMIHSAKKPTRDPKLYEITEYLPKEA